MQMKSGRCALTMRTRSQVWQIVGSLFWLLGSMEAVAAGIEHNVAHKTWTLTSGAEMYRLADRDGVLSVDYFGPAAGAPNGASGTPTLVRQELVGEAEGQTLSGNAMRLVDEKTNSPASGVQVLTLTLRHKRLPLDIVAQYTAWGDTGVFTREITLKNTGDAAIEVASALSLSLELPRGGYTLRHLYGEWGEEHQLATETLNGGGRSFGSASGRSTNGFAPWISLRNEDDKTEYLAELAWSGNWDMRVSRQPGTEPSVLREQPVMLSMAMHWDFGGSLNLARGATYILPKAAFTTSSGDLDDVTNQMHSYQRQFVFPRSHANRPPLVQFNSWYPFQGKASLGDMERLADVASTLGAEVFVLDAGWYNHTDWSKELGDYEPDPHAFPHGLEELSEYVRARKMKFGLWMEIENIGLESTMFQKHSDWCLAYNGAPIRQANRCQLDFSKPEVRAWATATVDRLVNKYKLSWIKIDYNIDIGDRFDPHGKNRPGDVLAQHVKHYYAWLDTIRAAHPDLIIENCSSGALRMDTGMLAHTHTNWLSDNVDPIESLQLGFGCTIQFSPEVCNHWMVGDNDRGLVDLKKTPSWWDFMFRVPMNGQFGISSRVFDWNQPLKERAAENIVLYKQVRQTIAGADVYHLTAEPAHRNPTGWMAIEYVSPANGDSVLMAYRLGTSSAENVFHLRGLDEQAMYDISEDGRIVMHAVGSKLAKEGLPVRLGDEWNAAVFQIKKHP
jgi:alpha-galactosidase